MNSKIFRSVTLAFVLLVSAASAFAAGSTVVNVNDASTEQLQLLPGVGPAVAERIVTHREEHGPFDMAEDLMLVRGIGERTFERLEPFVTVDGDTTATEKIRLPKEAGDE